MEQFYKDHRVEITAWLDGDRRYGSVYILYCEGHKNILVTFPLSDTFATYDGAIEASLVAAHTG